MIITWYLINHFLGKPNSSSRIPSLPTPTNNTQISQPILVQPDILRNKENWVSTHQSSLIEYEGLIELVKSKNIQQINYRDLLNCFEWKFKRFKMLYRDKFTCVDCGERSYNLHVHHKFYLVNHLPWEIEDEGLVSLCRDCHAKRHQNENIAVFEIVNNRKVVSTVFYFRKCLRCDGTGYLPHFSHVENGICFLCYGNNIEHTMFSSRINYIVQNPALYNTNSSFNESFDFFDSITYDYFKNNILNKLENYRDDDDLPF